MHATRITCINCPPPFPAQRRSVAILHTTVFALTLGLVACYVLFMLRPFMSATKHEARRIAELLSQLPSELDVGGMMNKTLIADLGAAAADLTSAGKVRDLRAPSEGSTVVQRPS